MWLAVGLTVTVWDESPTGRRTGAVTLSDISTAITLRDLIRTRVREEVARYHLAGGEHRASWSEEADQAIESFARNGFFVLVDDRQITEVDEELTLTPETGIRFVRLTPLAGG